jgi:hypothetical protein
MNRLQWKWWIGFASLIALVALVVIGQTCRAAAAPDWKAVEQAIGKAGSIMPGGVYRVGLPRTDLTVTVQGIRVEPPSPSARTPRSRRSATRPWSWATSCSATRRSPPS